MGSTSFLSLPVELRYQIYSNIHQNDDEELISRRKRWCTDTTDHGIWEWKYCLDPDSPCKALSLVFDRMLCAISTIDEIIGHDITNYKRQSKMWSTAFKTTDPVLEVSTNSRKSHNARIQLPKSIDLVGDQIIIASALFCRMVDCVTIESHHATFYRNIAVAKIQKSRKEQELPQGVKILASIERNEHIRRLLESVIGRLQNSGRPSGKHISIFFRLIDVKGLELQGYFDLR